MQLDKSALSTSRLGKRVVNDVEVETSLTESDKAMTEGGFQQDDSKTGRKDGVHDEVSSGTLTLRRKRRRGGSADVSRARMSMVPFPTLVQARVLSRAWNSKFSSPSFQHEVNGSSHKWPRYCPVIVSGREMMGFNRATNRWQRIAIPESVPLDFDAEVGEIACGGIFLRLACGGSLMCVVERVVREPPKEQQKEII